MSIFRGHTPKRRNITKAVQKHGEHRDDLQKDYQYRCGYCNDTDSWKIAWFEVDHFVPHQYLVKISKTDYSNLVYACRSCNNAKRAKWPTKDENIHHINNQGFIDPCNDDYNNQFTRLDNGRIVPQTELGIWMYNTLQLYKPQHEIIWNIEQLDLMIDEINNILIQSQNTVLSNKLNKIYSQFHIYMKSLHQGNS